MLPPLVFTPLYRQYLWGGRRFADLLGRHLATAGPYAESWELVDRQNEQSVVRAGPLTGRTLGEIVREYHRELLGPNTSNGPFPLLFKFLDAHKVLSVQVHPDDDAAAQRTPPDRGKTEAWYIVEAEPGSKIYAGVKPDVCREDLAAAITAGCCEDVLHTIEPSVGDCIFIPAGTVHAIGAGLVVAEIQQSSDVTFRLFDWNRVDADGKSRPLHLEEGLAATNCCGPVAPSAKLPAADPAVSRMVDCDFFTFDEVTPSTNWQAGKHGCEFLVVLSGEIQLPDQWSMPSLHRGECLLLPACLETQNLRCRATADGSPRLLRVGLPNGQ